MDILYHYSPKVNRQSILEFGLLTKFDRTVEGDCQNGIYLTNKLENSNSDVFEVNIANLWIEEDPFTVSEDIEEKLYVCYMDIPLENIRLLS